MPSTHIESYGSENPTVSRSINKSIDKSSPEVSFTINVPGRSTRDDSLMFVTPAAVKNGLARKSYCMYCNTMQSKLVRHFENRHKNVDEVKRFADLPKNNPERLKIIDTLRKQCMFDFKTNNAVNDGELMVCRRPNEGGQKTAKDYKVCQNCKGFYTKTNIRHHAKVCFAYNEKKASCIWTQNSGTDLSRSLQSLKRGHFSSYA